MKKYWFQTIQMKIYTKTIKYFKVKITLKIIAKGHRFSISIEINNNIPSKILLIKNFKILKRM